MDATTLNRMAAAGRLEEVADAEHAGVLLPSESYLGIRVDPQELALERDGRHTSLTPATFAAFFVMHQACGATISRATFDSQVGCEPTARRQLVADLRRRLQPVGLTVPPGELRLVDL